MRLPGVVLAVSFALLAPPAAAHELVAAGDAAYVSVFDDATRAGQVKVLDRSGLSETVALQPRPSPTSSPSLALGPGGVFTAWRDNGSEAPGIYSGALRSPGVLRAPLAPTAPPVLLEVAGTRDGGHMIAWTSNDGVTVQRVGPDGVAAPAEAVTGSGRVQDFRLVSSGSGAVWLVLLSRVLEITRIDVPEDERDTFIVGARYERILDAAGGRGSRVLVAAEQRRDRRRLLRVTEIEGSVAATTTIAQAPRDPDFRASVTATRDGGVVAYSAPGAGGRLDAFVRTTGGRRLARISTSSRDRELVEDVAVNPRNGRVLVVFTRGRRGAQDLFLARVERRSRRVERTFNISRSRELDLAGRVAVDRRGITYLAWLRDRGQCSESLAVVAGTGFRRLSRPQRLTDCPG